MADRYAVVVDGTGYGHQELGPGATDTLAVDNLDVNDILLLPLGSTFPTSPSDGQLWYDNSSGERILYIYDGSRSKWLSSSEWVMQWGHDDADGELLRNSGISSPATGTGVRIPHDCTIVRITARQTDGETAKQVDVLINGTSALNFDISSNVYTSNTVNQDVDAGDYIWLEIEAAGGGSKDVSVSVWFAWRGA